MAKGVMHRHFADFDTFLAELILDRAARLDETVHLVAGTGAVVNNLSEALGAAFTPLGVAIVALVVTREGLRERLREADAARFPLLAETSAMLRAYLAQEQALGRVAASADVSTLSHLIIGSAHLLFTDREGGPPDAAAIHTVLATVMQGVM